MQSYCNSGTDGFANCKTALDAQLLEDMRIASGREPEGSYVYHFGDPPRGGQVKAIVGCDVAVPQIVASILRKVQLTVVLNHNPCIYHRKAIALSHEGCTSKKQELFMDRVPRLRNTSDALDTPLEPENLALDSPEHAETP